MRKTFYGQVKNGKLEIIDRDAYDMAVSALDGKSVEVSIGDLFKNRSIPQNKLYWGGVVRAISDHTGMFPDEVHEFLKRKFLTREFHYQGRVFEYARSTTGLDTKEFTDYVDKCVMWAGSELGLSIDIE